MAPLVRVRDWQALRKCVLAAGAQVDIAARSGMSLQRLNQLVTGTAITIDAEKAGQLEDVLNVPRGTYFRAPQVLAPYITTDEPGDAGTPASAPAPDDVKPPTV